MQPLVSVIIPNYNHAPFLKQRIDSVLNQTFQTFEVIILDDCSTDNSRGIIEEYRSDSRIKHIVYNKTNSGSPFNQWKRGIELSCGDYIWIAESDDWASTTFLELLIFELSNNPDIGICFSGSNWIDDMGNKGKDLSIYTNDFFRNGVEEIKEHMVKYCSIQNVSAVIIKKAIAEKHINRILKYKACGDWHLYIDVLNGSNIIYVAKKLNNFRWYHNNISNSAEKKGLWISEGLKVLAYSDAFKIKYTKSEFISIFKFWFLKSNQFKSIKKFQLQILSICYLSIFTLKNIYYRSIVMNKIK